MEKYNLEPHKTSDLYTPTRGELQINETDVKLQINETDVKSLK
jgi:hypothetical protein